jgi:hypothetical protein
VVGVKQGAARSLGRHHLANARVVRLCVRVPLYRAVGWFLRVCVCVCVCVSPCVSRTPLATATDSLTGQAEETPDRQRRLCHLHIAAAGLVLRSLWSVSICVIYV